MLIDNEDKLRLQVQKKYDFNQLQEFDSNNKPIPSSAYHQGEIEVLGSENIRGELVWRYRWSDEPDGAFHYLTKHDHRFSDWDMGNTRGGVADMEPSIHNDQLDKLY